jgi:outer membrane lipoprotein SlyB
MKKILWSSLCVFILLLNLGCQSAKTRTAEGAVVGGVLGATVGGIVGHQSHHGAEGAGIGAAAGAIAGAIIGSQIEKPGQATPSSQTGSATQAANPNQMSLQQIIDLTQEGVNEAVIIDKIHLSNSRFSLSASDIDYLRQQGVSQKVIDAMQGMQ